MACGRSSHTSAKELIEKNARAFRTSDSFHTKYQIAIEIDATCEQWTFASDTLDELFDAIKQFLESKA
jgi:hypothetical protein